MRHVPEIKLIRTDTTLDLSQKAEKVCMSNARGGPKTVAHGGSVMGAGTSEAKKLQRPRGHPPKQVPAADKKSAQQSRNPPNKSLGAQKNKGWLRCSATDPDRKTRAESHAIDATRHLYALQYPVWNLSRLQMIHGSSNLALLCAPRGCVWSWPEGYRNFNR